MHFTLSSLGNSLLPPSWFSSSYLSGFEFLKPWESLEFSTAPTSSAIKGKFFPTKPKYNWERITVIIKRDPFPLGTVIHLCFPRNAFFDNFINSLAIFIHHLCLFRHFCWGQTVPHTVATIPDNLTNSHFSKEVIKTANQAKQLPFATHLQHILITLFSYLVIWLGLLYITNLVMSYGVFILIGKKFSEGWATRHNASGGNFIC